MMSLKRGLYLAFPAERTQSERTAHNCEIGWGNRMFCLGILSQRANNAIDCFPDGFIITESQTFDDS